MTIIEGQIESLKKVKKILNLNGINRFHSIGQINNFLKNFNSERSNIKKEEEYAFDLEIKNLHSECEKSRLLYEELKNIVTDKVNNKIKELTIKLDLLKSKASKNVVIKILYLLPLKITKSKINNLEKNFQIIIQRKTKKAEDEAIGINTILETHERNKGKIIAERSSPKIKELNLIKDVVEEMNPLIAGAIGENLVVKEIKKLSDDFILFNDFSLEFRPPIYNRKENDRIFSIQIDHLLVTNSGVFILETKNWSKKSIDNFDLRSPVEQIKRTSYALFVIFNSDSRRNRIVLNSHHWGNKQIPIRNIVVMIKDKPKENFQYVKIKSLNELNGYIMHFNPIFNDEEVKIISDHLRMIKC